MELLYGLDLREKSYLETLKLTALSSKDLKTLENEKYTWRFLNPEQSFLDVKFTAKMIQTADLLNLQKLKKNITWLNLTDCSLNDDHLSYLSDFPHLTRLKIQRNPSVTDKGIEALKGLENLSELNLYGTRVSNAALMPLGQMESLKKLFLWNTRITPEAIADFRIQHPDIEIVAGL